MFDLFGRKAVAALGALALLLGSTGSVVAQDTTPRAASVAAVDLSAAAAAVDSGDLEALRAVASDTTLINQLRATDMETLIAFHLALAQAYEQAGLNQEAIDAYQQALLTIMMAPGRGQGHISMAEPMEAIGRLAQDPETKARWFTTAFELRERVWGQDNPNLAPYRAQADAARATAGQDALVRADTGTRDGEANFSLINVYYATHRTQTGATTPAAMFGGERGPINYGVAEVSVPLNRRPGTIPMPSVWSFEFRPDPNRHMVLNTITPVVDRDSFFSRVTEVVGASGRKEAFVFVHGYNTSFEGALIRTAQLATDMNLDGAPILYSWPSQASLLGYGADTRATADRELLDDVAAFITDVAQRTGAERVHLVAHSMGNRVLMRALDRVAAQRPGEQLFDEVVLAAADVGVDEFAATLPRITPTGERFTLYASGRDRALQISEQVNRMRRAGDARSIMVMDGLQTVDTTAASGGLLGHDDFAGSALADFRGVMWLSLAPDRRCVLETAQAGGRQYWAFGGGCPQDEFDEAAQMVRAEGAVETALAKLDSQIREAGATAREGLERKRRRLAAMFGMATASSGG